MSVAVSDDAVRTATRVDRDRLGDVEFALGERDRPRDVEEVGVEDDLVGIRKLFSPERGLTRIALTFA